MSAFSGPNRRRFLHLGALTGLGWAVLPAFAQKPRVQKTPFLAEVAPSALHTGILAAAWGRDEDAHVGLVRPATEQAAPTALEVLYAHPVPGRAHGMTRLADGALLFASRRPGDWLLRLNVANALENADNVAQLHWIEPDRAFNGHVIGWGARHVLTTETDLDTGWGLVGVREAATLEKIAEWPTLGHDPHQLLADPADAGALIVANGGIITQSDTGRRKLQRQAMDSSIVRLRLFEAHGGALNAQPDGQWQLPDPRISLRHLAWGSCVAYQKTVKNQMPRRWLGIATQAEHDEDSARNAAPILALWDGERLTAAEPAPPHAAWAGYGGDIAWDFPQIPQSPSAEKAVLGRGSKTATSHGAKSTLSVDANGLFAVSAPRADALTWWQPPTNAAASPARLVAERTLLGAYALAENPEHGIFVAGQYQIQHWQNTQKPSLENTIQLLFDNHWQVL